MAREIWSNTATMDYVATLSPEEVRDFLVNDLNYDEEMVAELDDSELDDVLYDEGQRFDDWDLDELEGTILPELERQTEYSIAIELHNGGNRGMGGRVRTLEDLFKTDYDATHKLMANDDGSLYIEEYSHDVPTGMVIELYTYPKDVERFVSVCLGDLIDEKLALYEDNPDYSEQDAIDDAILDLEYRVEDAIDIIENYCDFSKVPEVCEPFRWLYGGENESLEEDAPVESPLKDETEELELDIEDFGGPDYLYSVPLTRFKRDYPEFYSKVVQTFLTFISKGDADEYDFRKASPEELNDWWQDGELIQETDWPALIEFGKKLADGKNPQWKDIWKKYYNTFES